MKAMDALVPPTTKPLSKAAMLLREAPAAMVITLITLSCFSMTSPEEKASANTPPFSHAWDNISAPSGACSRAEAAHAPLHVNGTASKGTFVRSMPGCYRFPACSAPGSTLASNAGHCVDLELVGNQI